MVKYVAHGVISEFMFPEITEKKGWRNQRSLPGDSVSLLNRSARGVGPEIKKKKKYRESMKGMRR